MYAYVLNNITDRETAVISCLNTARQTRTSLDPSFQFFERQLSWRAISYPRRCTNCLHPL